MATLTVGTGKQFATIAAATAAAKDGDTVAVSAGTYVNDYAAIKTKISLVAVGGAVTMLSTLASAPAAALLTITTDAVVDGLTFSGMRTAAGTGAGVLVQAGTVTVKNSLFTGNQNGLVATNAATSLTIAASEFARNGDGDGFTHNVSAGSIKALTITGSYIHDAQGGDEVRSLAASTAISGTRIEDNTAAAAVSIDLPGGGKATLQGNTIQKGAGSVNAVAIRYGGGAVQAGALSVSGNTVVSDRAGAVLLQNLTGTIASVASNTAWGFAAVTAGLAATFANVVAATRPTLSAAPLIPGPAEAADYGRAGAVMASGHVLTVGAGQAYATVAAAIAAAADGDTIDVLAGVYVNDTAVVSHKVIIQGVGGIAQFVAVLAPANGLAQFVTTTDVTFKNIEIFGVMAPSGAAAAIRDQGGNLTIDNSVIHDNQAGVVAAAGGSVGIFDSEIARNGTAAGTGAEVSVAEVSTLTLQNDDLHDAVGAPEVVSGADSTDLSGDRIKQAAGATGAAVVLPNGGAATIAGSAIEGSGARLVQVGGGAAVYGGSAVSLVGNTLISDATAAPVVFVANTAPAVRVTATGTTFVGGPAGSTQVSGGTNAGATVGPGLTVATELPWAASGAPAPGALTVMAPGDAAGPQRGILVLDVSETAWEGDATFTLAVDGAPVGGTLTATASHAAGQTQTITVAGVFAAGPHAVVAAFTNSLGMGGLGSSRSGAGVGARALFVDGAQFNGQDLGQTAALTANGTTLIETAPIATPTVVTVNLSEDAWHGDALAFIGVDGAVQGGVQVVTASHAAGQTQAISFLLDLAPGPHTASVTFLNGVAAGAGASRNLYVGSIDVAAAHYPAAAASLAAGGTSAFSFTVAPPAAANASLFVTVGNPQDLLPMS